MLDLFVHKSKSESSGSRAKVKVCVSFYETRRDRECDIAEKTYAIEFQGLL